MKTGQYKKQLTGTISEYQAFIPNMLPFQIKRDEELDDLLSKANISLGRLDMVFEIVPDVDYFVFMYITKEATASSQVEGTQATFSDVLKKAAKIEDSKIPYDVKEIINYINAVNYGVERLKSFPLSSRLIKEIHKILLKDVRGQERQPGEFRLSQNWIGGTSINSAAYVPPPQDQLDSLLNNFEKFLHDKSPTPILLKVGLLHSQFENIHPFLDGNGRIGRLLITFYLYHEGILKKPSLYISSFFKKHRPLYYQRLNEVHEKDNIEQWLKFFLEGVIYTSEEAIRVARLILKLRNKDIEQVSKLGKSSSNALLVLNNLFRNPYVTRNTVQSWIKLSKSNTFDLIYKLVNIGILKELKINQKEKQFIYQDYFELFK